MNQKNRTLKIAGDLTLWQLTWAAFFLAAIILFFFGMRIFTGDESLLTRPFLEFLLQPGSGFMLVLGLMSVPGFLTFMVKQGVTRRAYFVGTAISSLVIAILLTAAGIVIQFIVQSIMTGADWQPVLGYASSMLTAVPVILCQLYLFHLVGWIIGGTFYRYGVISGLISIAGCLALLMGISYLISAENSLPASITDRLGLPSLSREVSLSISLPSLVLIAVLLLALLRLMTKRVRVKIK